MKKLIYTLAVAALLLSCSAQQRINRILTKHPELKRIDTVQINDTIYIKDTIILPGEHNSTNLTIKDIHSMDSTATAQNAPIDLNVQTNHTNATLTAQGNGLFTLTTEQKPDTIILQDTVYRPKFFFIPTIKTETQYVPKTVYKMRWFQKIPFWIGIATIIALILIIVKKFILK